MVRALGKELATADWQASFFILLTSDVMHKKETINSSPDGTGTPSPYIKYFRQSLLPAGGVETAEGTYLTYGGNALELRPSVLHTQ